MSTRRMLTRSVSAVSEAGNKVICTLRPTITRRKTDPQFCSADGDDTADPAFLLAQALGGQFISKVATPITPEVGCRQGGYFDSCVFDFGIPKVNVDEEDGSEADSEDTAYEFVVLNDTAPASPTSEDWDDKPTLRGLRKLTEKMRKLRETTTQLFRTMSDSSDSLASAPELESELEVSVATLSPADVEPAQFERMSVASDATTGTLARYLARQQAHQRVDERSLSKRAGGMSILAYEREGSWIVDASCDSDDPAFACPFPHCEAHYGHSRNPVMSRTRLRERHRLAVETVYED